MVTVSDIVCSLILRVFILIASVPLVLIQVEVWRGERVEKRKYETSYKWIVERAKKGFLYNMFTVFGHKHRKTMFIIWQFVYTTLSILPAYLSYH